MQIYIAIFVILSLMCPIETTCSEIREQLLAFSKGAASTSLGMLAGYLIGSKTDHKIVGTATGAVVGMLADHYLADGQDDPHIARKIGYTLPILIGGMIVHCVIQQNHNVSTIPNSEVKNYINMINLQFNNLGNEQQARTRSMVTNLEQSWLNNISQFDDMLSDNI